MSTTARQDIEEAVSTLDPQRLDALDAEAARLLEEQTADEDMPLEARPHDVYRIFDDQGRLLYIGCARDWTERIHMHEALRRQNAVSDAICHRGYRVTVEIYRNKAMARAAEKTAIKAEAPHLNLEHNSSRYRRVRGAGYVPTGELPGLPPMTDDEEWRGLEPFAATRLISRT